MKKNPGLNLTKHIQNLCAENHKYSTEGIKDDLSKWKNICSWIGRLNLSRCQFFSSSSIDNAIPIKIRASSLMDTDKLISKVYMERPKTQNSQPNTKEQS